MDFPIQFMLTQTFPEMKSWGEPSHGLWHLQHAVYEGLFERFDCPLLLQGIDFSWLPFLMYRMDDHYLEEGEEIPYVQQLPSEYIQENCYFSSHPLPYVSGNEEFMAWMVKMVGPETIVYGSHLPEYDYETPTDAFDSLSHDFDESIIREILCETMADIVDIPP